MLGYLQQAGYAHVTDINDADVVIVNTCAFIDSAKEEAITELLSVNELRYTGKLRWLIAAGCLSQRYSSELLTEMPEVDAFLGSSSYPRISEVLTRLQQGEHSFAITEAPECYLPNASMPKKRLTLPAVAFLKIADGCNNCCSYCTIPFIRGKYRSRSIEDILLEAKNYLDTGAVEICLVAQDSTAYGTDIYNKPELTTLCSKLLELEDLRWLRVLYCHPKNLTTEFLQLMATEERLCSYLDLPLQHSEDRVLQAMARPVTKEETIKLIVQARQIVPDLMLRTTFITGFPGETQEEFEAMCDFVTDMHFDHLGAFAYSQEEDTPAGKMGNQHTEQTKTRRRNQLMEIQQGISELTMKRWLGRKVDVLIEAEGPDGIRIGRFWGQAPDVDGLVYLQGCTEEPGSLVLARITGIRGYDFTAESVGARC